MYADAAEMPQIDLKAPGFPTSTNRAEKTGIASVAPKVLN